MTTSADNLDKLEENLVKANKENDQEAKFPAKLVVKKSRVSGRFSSQGDYKTKKSGIIRIKKSFENLNNDSIETLKNRENLKVIDETYSNSLLTNQRKSINFASVEAGLL